MNTRSKLFINNIAKNIAILGLMLAPAMEFNARINIPGHLGDSEEKAKNVTSDFHEEIKATIPPFHEEIKATIPPLNDLPPLSPLPRPNHRPHTSQLKQDTEGCFSKEELQLIKEYRLRVIKNFEEKISMTRSGIEGYKGRIRYIDNLGKNASPLQVKERKLAKNLVKLFEDIEKDTLSDLAEFKQNTQGFNTSEETSIKNVNIKNTNMKNTNMKNTNMKNAFKTAGNTLKALAKTPMGIVASILGAGAIALGLTTIDKDNVKSWINNKSRNTK